MNVAHSSWRAEQITRSLPMHNNGSSNAGNGGQARGGGTGGNGSPAQDGGDDRFLAGIGTPCHALRDTRKQSLPA